MVSLVKVATLGELPVGAKKLVEVDGRAIALFNVAGTIHAIDDVCTHDGGPLAEGELKGCEIECPRHGARFDVTTGRPLSMPAIEPVAVHEIRVQGETSSWRSMIDVWTRSALSRRRGFSHPGSRARTSRFIPQESHR